MSEAKALHERVIEVLCIGGTVGEGGLLASAVIQAVEELEYLADAEFDRGGGRNEVSYPLYGIVRRLKLALDLHTDEWLKAQRANTASDSQENGDGAL